MSSDDIRLSVEVDTNGAVADLDKVGDASRTAGEALDELARKADKVDPTVTVDIDIDQAKARAAADALDDIDRKGRGMADGVGFGNNALRDLTGPLGDAVGPAGDLGDAFEGLGDIVGGIAGKLGLGADAVGKLTGAVAGVGVVVAAGVAAWSLYRNSQKEAEEQARKLYEAQEALADGNLPEAAAGLVEQYKGTIKALRDLGYESGTIVGILKGQGDVVAELDGRIDALTSAYDQANLAAAEGKAGEQDRANAIRDQIDGLVTLQNNLESAPGVWAANEEAIRQNREVLDAVIVSLGGTIEGAEAAAESVGAIEKAFTDLTRAIDEADAIENVRDAFDRVEEAALAAWDAAQAGAPDADALMRDYKQTIRDALTEVVNLDERIDDIPPETVARIFAEVQQGDLDEAKRILDDVEKNIDPIKLTIDLEDLEKKAFVAAARARAGAGAGGSGGSSPVGGGSGGGPLDPRLTTIVNYYPPRVSPAEQYRAQTAYRRVNGD